ncbi:uncharacterized protein LOC118436268 [Folsomia candida]|uniref:Vitellogenin receptor n=1 Tax=Folsomia candida TaxID=158441 RepID=A0A226E278_FOLCA|nr:uncharacterized protein LOC118436268 [Folsomia candida]OXA51832.1 Vitellogenin receptor [Folsomia candida]
MIAIELVRAIFFGVVLSATIGNSEAMTVEGVRNFEKEMEKLSLRRQKRHPEHLAADYPTWVRVGECPITLDGHHQYYCPTPSPDGRWVCLDDYQLCDGIRNCPNAEDECLHWCLFYKSLKSEVSLLSRSMAALFKREQLMEEDVVVLHAKVDQVRQEDESASRHHRQNGRFVPVE